jgi:hypothetical protein
MTPGRPDVSVVVAVVERPGSLVELYREVTPPLGAAGLTFEVIFATYPWFRGLTAPLTELAAQGEPIRVLEIGQALGETALLKAAASTATAPIILTVPAYPQADPSVLPALVDRIRRGADLAVACRSPRRDSLVNRIQSWILHAFVGHLAGGKLRDVACGVRAMRWASMAEVPLYGDFSRFLPLIALREGFQVEEVAAPVHPRALQARVYSPGTYLRRLVDVLGLLFLLKFTDKPLRFFGLFGTVAGGIGAVMLVIVFLQRVTSDSSIADRPLLLLGVLLLTVGIQAIALGLVGEIIVHYSVGRQRRYRIREQDTARTRPDAA